MSTASLQRVRKAQTKVDFTTTREWLKQHSREYIGKWVVLDGDRLIGQGDDPRPIVEQARRAGSDCPVCRIHQR